jgi:hypothetical protein
MKWSDYTEPALIRGVGAAVLQLCAALGVVLPFDLPGALEALILILAVVVPLVQAIWTRAKVWSQRSKDQAVGLARTGLAEGPS